MMSKTYQRSPKHHRHEYKLLQTSDKCYMMPISQGVAQESCKRSECAQWGKMTSLGNCKLFERSKGREKTTRR